MALPPEMSTSMLGQVVLASTIRVHETVAWSKLCYVNGLDYLWLIVALRASHAVDWCILIRHSFQVIVVHRSQVIVVHIFWSFWGWTSSIERRHPTSLLGDFLSLLSCEIPLRLRVLIWEDLIRLCLISRILSISRGCRLIPIHDSINLDLPVYPNDVSWLNYNLLFLRDFTFAT